MVESLEVFKKNNNNGSSNHQEEQKQPVNLLLMQEHTSASVLSEMGPLTVQNKWT